MSSVPFTIGGSDAGAACGVDPFRSPYALWCLKTGRMERPEPTEAMAWGTLLEPAIFEELGRRGYLLRWPFDNTVDEWTLRYADSERPWLVGHPDALADGGYVVDAKTTSQWMAHYWDDGQAPPWYIVQLHVYMHLTGCDRGLLACLIAGQRLALREFARDEKIIEATLAGLDRFEECVRRDIPPPPRGEDSDADALRAQFPGGGERVRFDRAGLALVREYADIERQYRNVKRQLDERKQQIQLLMGDAELAVNLADEPVAKWTTFERNGKPTRRFSVA